MTTETSEPTGPVEQKDRVRSFWESEPCGWAHGDAPEGTKEFFDQIERRRDELEPYISRFADFEASRGKRVLEIGVGLGSDFVRFVRAGAIATGVDLTERGVELVRRRLALEGLEAEVVVADAERLPFADASFDRVYSWGVLHHTPDTATAVREAIRVLRPGGQLTAMLYARRSWVAFGFWVRHALLAGRPLRSIASVLAAHMESTGTKAYTTRELSALFGELDGLRLEKVLTPYDRQIAGPLARLTGSALGWNLVVSGRKSA